MTINKEQLGRLVPYGVALLIFALGWVLLVQPTLSRRSAVATQAFSLRERMAGIQRSVSGPAPPEVRGNPQQVFEREMPTRDTTSDLIEQLTRLALKTQAANLLIETGDRVEVGTLGANTPQASTASLPDPRLSLFNVQMAYSPITMSFDAEYSKVGDMLWRLRDLVTTVEMRSFEMTPVTDAAGRVHVAMTIHAYSRHAAPRAAAE